MGKLYVFGDFIAESYLLQGARNGDGKYDQPTTLQIIKAGAHLPRHYFEEVKNAMKEVNRSYYLEQLKNWDFDHLHYSKMRQDDKKNDNNNKVNDDKKKDCSCPYSYSTLVKSKNKFGKEIYLTRENDGYERIENSVLFHLVCTIIKRKK